MDQADRAVRDERIVTMTREGLSASQIGAALGCTARTVTRVRARLDCLVHEKARPLTDAQLEAADQLLSDGCSIAEAARTVGASEMGLHRRFPGRAWNRAQISEYNALCRRMRGFR